MDKFNKLSVAVNDDSVRKLKSVNNLNEKPSFLIVH